MADAANCHINAQMYDGDTEVVAYFRFGNDEDAAHFFEVFAKAVEEGTIRVGPAEFPPTKTVREVA